MRVFSSVILALLVAAPLAAQPSPQRVNPSYPPGVTAPLFIVPASGVRGGGTVTSTLCFDATNPDVGLKRASANNIGVTNCSSTTYWTIGSSGIFGGPVIAVGTSPAAAGTFRGPYAGTIAFNNSTAGADVEAIRVGTWNSVTNTIVVGANGSSGFAINPKTTYYNGVGTVGWGQPAIYGSGAVDGTVNARSAAVATYTNGATDGMFEVSGNVNVTTSATHSFSLDVSYTDETNTARVLVLPMAQLAGSFVASGLITNVTGTGPYESPVMHIRVKASTAITIRPSSGGTYTSVTYNAAGSIKQIS